jgi:hypothetical protein
MSSTSRRGFLRAAALAVVALATAPSRADTGRGDGVAALAQRLTEQLACRTSAARVGAVYLSQFPKEADARTLCNLLCNGERGGLTDGLGVPRESNVRALLHARHQGDLHHGRVVWLQGWLLSRTEARLYGLAALLAHA